jgi:hypothetical protein
MVDSHVVLVTPQHDIAVSSLNVMSSLTPVCPGLLGV